MIDENIILKIKGIKKRFPGIQALDFVVDSSIPIKKGEIHSIIGENGAGKSTLVNIIAGIYSKDSGEMLLDGESYLPKNIKDAEKMGISIILQEPGLIPSISVADNIFIGRESSYKKFGFIIYKKQVSLAKEVIDKFMNIDPKIITNNLSFENQKLVELIRASSLNPKIIIIDETSAALSYKTRKILFSIIHEFKNNGKSVIFVSHQLDEVLEISDNITILKDGKIVKTLLNKKLDRNILASLMVGGRALVSLQKIEQIIPSEKVLLSVRDLTLNGYFKNINFNLHEKEILGIGGITGCGSAEMGKVIFGDLKPDKGKIIYKGKEIKFFSIANSIDKGIAYIPKNRDKEGLMLRLNIKHNISLPILKKISSLGIIKLEKEKAITKSLIKKLRIKCKDEDDLCISLSGGNRQKVVIAKCFITNASLYIFDNPTRGVDVGTKQEIYSFIGELVKNGAGVLIISDEIPELLSISDEIIILKNGSISKNFHRKFFPEEKELIEHMI
jgi:ABC-type sugar transport system ATPase subunit